MVGEIYYCWIQNNIQIWTPERAHIDEITGTHLDSKSNNDVNGIWVDNEMIHYFPQRLESFFLNLTFIYISNAGLKEVHQSDLKPFSKLMELHLDGNEIEIIDEDLFEFNRELQYISFVNNKIYHIHPDVFNNLFSLEYLRLEYNKCISRNADNNNEYVRELIDTLHDKCLSFEYKFLNEKVNYNGL